MSLSLSLLLKTRAFFFLRQSNSPFHRLTLHSPSPHTAANPSKVHLYVNRENLGFEDCDDVDPTQTLNLTTEDLKEEAPPVALKYVLYQRVSSLTIFIEDNQGAEITALGGLQLLGQTMDTVNMADFNKKEPQG